VKSVRSILIIVAAGLALAAGLAFAQTEGGHGGMHRGMAGHMMGGPEFGMFLHQLNLTDDQKAQVKQIFHAERPNIKPLMQQEFQARHQMMQLITSDKFDPKQAQLLAAQEAQIHMQIEVEHAKMGAQIYQLLSSDQKAKVTDIMAKHQQMMQEHLQKQGQGAPSE
jgi:periplasmic protein CpxP/Spy